MAEMRSLSFWLILWCFAGVVANAQCAQQWNSTEHHCETSTCNDTILTFTPVEDSCCYHFSCESVDCCGELFSTCPSDEEECGDALTRSPEVRKRLSELSATSKILVADCRGHYSLYAPRLQDTTGKRGQTFAVNDHILR
jgi:hypothetical protein